MCECPSSGPGWWRRLPTHLPSLGNSWGLTLRLSENLGFLGWEGLGGERAAPIRAEDARQVGSQPGAWVLAPGQLSGLR